MLFPALTIDSGVRPYPPDARRSAALRTDCFASILVVLTMPLGDTLFARPALQAVRRRYPTANITALGLPSNESLLARFPELDDIIICRWRAPWLAPIELLRLGSALRTRSFDLCIEMTPVGALFSSLAGIPARVGFGFRSLWWLLPDRPPTWRRRHAVHHYVSLVRQLGATAAGIRPRLPLCDDDRAVARQFLTAAGIDRDDVVVTVHAGASSRLKRWSPRRFAELIDRLQSRQHVRVVVIGGAGDRRIAASVLRHTASRPVDAVGKLDVVQTAALQEQAALHIGNDSGPLHLAAAVGTATVGLFGPTNARNYRPLGSDDTVVHRPKACSPCTHFVGGSSVLARPMCRTCGCLDELTVDEVETVCSARLAAHRRSSDVTS